jgi:hypothetical protein
LAVTITNPHGATSQKTAFFVLPLVLERVMLCPSHFLSIRLSLFLNFNLLLCASGPFCYSHFIPHLHLNLSSFSTPCNILLYLYVSRFVSFCLHIPLQVEPPLQVISVGPFLDENFHIHFLRIRVTQFHFILPESLYVCDEILRPLKGQITRNGKIYGSICPPSIIVFFVLINVSLTSF